MSGRPGSAIGINQLERDNVFDKSRGGRVYEGHEHCIHADSARFDALVRRVEGVLIMTGPLEGIRILESGRYFAGPLVGTLLGDMGADVIHLEQPGVGDPLRRSFPPLIGDTGPYFLWASRNKRSATLNLDNETGQQLFDELVEKSDVVVLNFTWPLLDRWGITYERLKKIRPDIILCTVSAYGATGPYRDRPAIDYVIQAHSGLMSLSGDPEGPPTISGVAISDYVGGFINTYAVQSALIHRLRTGEGQWIDNSLFDSSAFLLQHSVLHWATSKEFTWRKGSLGSPLSRAYPTKSGHVYIVGVFPGFTDRFFTAIGHPEILEDPRFPKPGQPADQGALLEWDAVVEQWTTGRTTDEVMEVMLAARVMAAPVNDVAGVVEDEQYRSRGNLVEIEHPQFGTLQFQGPVPKLSATPASVRTPPPLLGQHNEEIFVHELGHTPEEMATWLAAGII